MNRKDTYEDSVSFPESDAEQDEIQVADDAFVKNTQRSVRFTRYFLLCLLVLLFAVTVIANRDSINLDNLRRMMAKIDISLSLKGDVDGKKIEFNYDEDSVVTAFKDGLAYLSPSKLTIMDNIGTVFMTANTGYTNPQLLTCKKYAVAYDLNGSNLIVTNSFAVLFEKAMDEPICKVAINDEGYIAVITQGSGYKNTLHVYNNSFEEIYVWQSTDRYLVNAALSPDSKTLAMICYNVKDCANKQELVCIRLNKDEVYWAVPLEEAVPLDLIYKNDSLITLVQTDRLSFYNIKGKNTAVYQFENNFLQAYDASNGDYTALTLSGSKRGNTTLYIINNRGKKTSDMTLEENVTALDVKGDRIGLLTDDCTYIYSASSKKVFWKKENSGNILKICFGGKNCLLDIYNTFAVYNEVK